MVAHRLELLVKRFNKPFRLCYLEITKNERGTYRQ
jgi:hypothetical protein